MTRFLAGQLATAHWFDQRLARGVLDWSPRISLDQGFALLAQGGASADGADPSRQINDRTSTGVSRTESQTRNHAINETTSSAPPSMH